MKPGDHPEFFRFPAPEGASRESSIRLDRDGQFWHDGERLEHPKLEEAFHTWLRRHPDDRRYILTNGYDWTYVTVDDAPFTVRAVHHEGGRVRLVLSSGDTVELTALSQASDGSLYTPVRLHDDTFEARFSRLAQTQLEPALVERDGQVGVQVGDSWLLPGPRRDGGQAG